MEKEIIRNLRNLYLPSTNSHKGQNGKLLIIGGSKLFHAASLWALKVASRIVDLVHYSSVPENNRIVQKTKEEFRDGIVVPRAEVESYIKEDDCVLIGPGMVRTENSKLKMKNAKLQRKVAWQQRCFTQLKIKNLKDIEAVKDEGMQTYYLTRYLLNKYPDKKWVIDAGALQMMEPEWIPKDAILTPHIGEFERLKLKVKSEKLKVARLDSAKRAIQNSKFDKKLQLFAKEYKCIVLLKGREDIVASKDEIKKVKGGNAGMTKGGTGDVLAGLVAALYCKNDAFLAATAASYINKKSGDDLYKKMGYWFNASDLADQIPQTMNRLFL